jgi:exodeoxyribonuclease V alpha subunit
VSTARQLPLLDASGYGAPVAGRVTLVIEVVSELRAKLDDDLGAVLRGRLPGGGTAVFMGPDLPQRQVGSTLRVAGYWDATRRQGRVFRVQELQRIERPQSVGAVAAYLAANIPGLGRVRARRIAIALGSEALARLSEDPSLARPLFRGGTAEEIVLALSAWADAQRRDTAARHLTERLTAAGVRYGTVRRIIGHFSAVEAAAVVTLRHPYRLVEVPGVGWATADTIAQRLGVALDDPRRLTAACTLTLSEAPARGHTALPESVLVRRAARLAGRDVPYGAVINAARRLVEDGHAVDVAGLVGLPEMVALEAEIADHVVGLRTIPRPLPLAADGRIERVLDKSGVSFDQRTAVWNALRHGCSVLTGRPGAGKTTTLKSLVECARELDWRVQIVAPTGKAASRAAAVTGVPASTVHRLLAGEPEDAPAPLDVDLLIVDEASMCDIATGAWLLRAVAPSRRTRVVWCGDADQLPSVGPGQLLADLLGCGQVPTSRLTTVFRQAAGSPIVRNAHRLLDGQALDLADREGWRYVRSSRPVSTAAGAVLAEVFALMRRGFAPSDIQVLAPMRRGALGVDQLNRQLQAALNPDGARGPYVGGGVRARVGDRLVMTRNMYHLPSPVYNGEQGQVLAVERGGAMRVRIENREVILSGVHCLMANLSWAMTVHRTQGSEYPAVVLAYDDRAHRPMLDRRVLYTAITRAKQHLTLVGTDAALMHAGRGERFTTLAHHLGSLLSLPTLEVGHGT